MIEKLKAAGMVREKVIGVLCLTVIALASMIKMSEPENVIINVVVAIASFIAGSTGMRKPEPPNSFSCNSGT